MSILKKRVYVVWSVPEEFPEYAIAEVMFKNMQIGAAIRYEIDITCLSNVKEHFGHKEYRMLEVTRSEILKCYKRLEEKCLGWFPVIHKDVDCSMGSNLIFYDVTISLAMKASHMYFGSWLNNDASTPVLEGLSL